MTSPATENVYDVIVIGTGPIGQTVAGRARAAGLSVAAVERELVGGECSYWACIPSKAMLRPVVAVADTGRVDGARQAVTGPVDAPGVFARRDGWVTDWHDEGQANFLKSIGAELIRGHGRLAGARRVAVETLDGTTITLTARHAVAIATGSSRRPTACCRGWNPSPGRSSRARSPMPGSTSGSALLPPGYAARAAPGRSP
jgi:pyruvate/2-oxoglutarate dehydrogenase complex dihydrolipoamide dehydrogenase (E3) component